MDAESNPGATLLAHALRARDFNSGSPSSQGDATHSGASFSEEVLTLLVIWLWLGVVE